MITHPQRRPIEWSDQTLERAINGSIAIYYSWGQPIPYRLTPHEKCAFEQAKQQGYVLFCTRPNPLNAFRQWCEIHQQPIVYAERHGRFATIKMDILGDSRDCQLSEPSQEKIRTIHDHMGNPRMPCATTPVYTYISGVDPACAAFVAQAFMAIYQQNRGGEVLVPAFPTSRPENSLLVSRIEEARRQHYVMTHTAHDSLLVRWQDYCRVHAWPAIVVHEARHGHASVEVGLPQGVTFTAPLRAAIIRIGQEAGLAGGKGRRYFLGETGLHTTTPISTQAALFFASSIAGLLTEKGYFTPVDESWHA